jgi:hypothetical protein
MKELQLILGFVGFEMQLIKFHIDYELIKKLDIYIKMTHIPIMSLRFLGKM